MYINTQLHYDKRESTIVTKSSYTLHHTSFTVHRLKAKSNVPHNELNSVDHYTQCCDSLELIMTNTCFMSKIIIITKQTKYKQVMAGVKVGKYPGN